jgi:hypothetical protein
MNCSPASLVSQYSWPCRIAVFIGPAQPIGGDELLPGFSRVAVFMALRGRLHLKVDSRGWVLSQYVAVFMALRGHKPSQHSWPCAATYIFLHRNLVQLYVAAFLALRGG